MAEPQALRDQDELLHRQVHPMFYQSGRVGSQAFRPTPKDEGKLSVSRGALTSPEDAFMLYADDRGLESVGVWSVTVGECASVGLDAFPEPLTEPIPDPAHAFIDFRKIGSSAAVKLSKRLASMARARGRLHPKDDP